MNTVSFTTLKKMLGRNNTINAAIVELTPSDALTILEKYSGDNRKLKKSSLASYKQSMESGQWDEFNGATIVFDTNKKLIDGNHRITALASCNKNVRIKFVVLLGCSKSLYTDCGKTRTAADNILCQNGILSEENKFFYNKPVQQALNTICSIRGVTRKNLQFEFQRDAVTTHLNILQAFQFNVDFTSDDFRALRQQAGNFAAVMNAFALGYIDTSDVRHIAAIFTNLKNRCCNFTDIRDEAFFSLYECEDNNRRGLGGGFNQKICFFLMTQAIQSYKNGTRGAIHWPKDYSKIIMPETFDFSISTPMQIVNVHGKEKKVSRRDITKITKKIA